MAVDEEGAGHPEPHTERTTGGRFRPLQVEDEELPDPAGGGERGPVEDAADLPGHGPTTEIAEIGENDGRDGTVKGLLGQPPIGLDLG
jgi:hypothetical protein